MSEDELSQKNKPPNKGWLAGGIVFFIANQFNFIF